MARINSSIPQRARTQNNPLSLGTFSTTTLRNLHGSLGPKNQLVGYADTNQSSNGGFGGGTYNHWFSVDITSYAWIILTKAGSKAKYIQLSFYDVNQNPIQGRSLFDTDSAPGDFLFDEEDRLYYPYIGHAMGSQSALYNLFFTNRDALNDSRYFPLAPGRYLICVSSTRNEPIEYNVGVVIEFPPDVLYLLLEDLADDKIALEDGAIDTANTIEIGPIFTSSYVLATNYNAFTETLATVNSPFIVTIPEFSTWLIGDPIVTAEPVDVFLLDLSPTYDIQKQDHEHSLLEWKQAWNNEFGDQEPFPDLFVPLTTIP